MKKRTLKKRTLLPALLLSSAAQAESGLNFCGQGAHWPQALIVVLVILLIIWAYNKRRS